MASVLLALLVRSRGSSSFVAKGSDDLAEGQCNQALGPPLSGSDPRRSKDMIEDMRVTRSNNGGEIKRGEIKRGEIERGASLLVFFSLYGLYALQP